MVYRNSFFFLDRLGWPYLLVRSEDEPVADELQRVPASFARSVVADFFEREHLARWQLMELVDPRTGPSHDTANSPLARLLEELDDAGSLVLLQGRNEVVRTPAPVPRR